MHLRLIILLLSLLAAHAHAQLTRQANSTLTLPADLPVTTGYTRENALGTMTFASPICVASPPGETNRLFVVERGGNIVVVNNLSTTPVKTTFISLAAVTGVTGLTLDGECGLLSMAFHPNYATNGFFYIFYSFYLNEDGNTNLFQRVAKLRVSAGNANLGDTTFMEPLVTVLDPATNHNGGDLNFGADGYLYISMGDGGSGGDYFNNARFINKSFWGHLHRIDVDSLASNLAPNAHTQASSTYPSAVHAGRYKIPADNPFIGRTTWHNLAISASTVRTEIYAAGLRNPFRFTFDPPTGRLFLGDVGQDTYEEVNLITKGGDYGWCWREGLHAYPSPPAPVSPPGTGFNPINPIFEYDHALDTGDAIYGGAVIGGAIYRGNTLTELNGAYIFADNNAGYVAALRENAGVWTGEYLYFDADIADFGVDPRNGDLIYCDLGSNSLKRIIRAGTTGTAPPATLSAAGVFSNLTTLTPNTGIVAYDPNVAFWSDYAIKSRWFSIKNLTDTIGFSADGNWTFPTGMVWIKHFDFETTRGVPATRRKLETRILVKTPTDLYGLSYKWRTDQSDADLVVEEGLSELVPTSSPAQTWRYPSRSECRTCHTQAGGFALSMNTRQMNRTHTYGAATPNQIAALSGAGYFSAPVLNTNNLPALVAATDATASLEARVRSYLAVNCVQCHQPGGSAPGNWDARPTTPTDSASLINGILANTAGDTANRFAVPNDTSHSMVLKRLSGTGVPRMPPLGTNELDNASITLVTQWITSTLPTRQSLAQWQTSNFGGTGVPNAALSADPDKDGLSNALEYLRNSAPNTTTPFTLPVVTNSGATITLNFDQPANRACLIESSTNLTSWSPWNVPGNAPTYPASSTPRTLSGPQDTTARFFRLKLSEP